MYDLFTMTAVVDELRSSLVGSRIQSTGLTAGNGMVLEVYGDRRRSHVLASVTGDEALLVTTEEHLATDPEAISGFSLLLRKFCRGGTIVDIQQPELERVVSILIAKRMPVGDRAKTQDDDQEQLDWPLVYTRLVVEIMGRRSNVILVDESDVVMDALRRIPRSMSRVRPLLPGLPYALPPVGDRHDPRTATAAQLIRATSASDPDDVLHAVLVRSFRGVSPQVAREIAYRVNGSAESTIGDQNAETWNAFATVIRTTFSKLEKGDWSPTLYLNDEDDVVGYGAFPHTHLELEAKIQPVTSISYAVLRASEDASGPVVAFRHAGRVDRLRTSVESSLQRATTRSDSIRDQVKAAEAADQFRRWGEAIYANLWNIEPGQTVLQLDEESIPLPDHESPKAFAESLFDRYRKMQGATQQAPELLAEVQQTVDYLQQLILQLDQTTTFDDYADIQQEWTRYLTALSTDRGNAPLASRAKKSRVPLPFQDSVGNGLYVGRSGRQNEIITFDVATPDDLWFHARGVPGAHVILKSSSVMSDDLLERAASVAAWYSQDRNAGKVEVDIVQRRFVRKIKGGQPGMVTYRNERTVLVTPMDETTFTSG